MNGKRQSGSGRSTPQSAVEEEKASIFHNATPGERPPTDAGYLELLSFTLFFSAVGDRNVLTEKWPDILFGFKNFHVQRVAEFNETDLQEVSQRVPLLQDKPQLKAVVSNAAAMTQVSRVYGSFRKYLRSFEKDGQTELLKDMGDRFMMLEGPVGEEFLVAIGEKVKAAEPEPPAQPQRPVQRRGQPPHQQRQQRGGGAQPEANRQQQTRSNGQRQDRGQPGGGERGNAQNRNRDPRRGRFHWRKKKPAGGSGAPTETTAPAKSS